jgi:CheY-like chemotaxis protein
MTSETNSSLILLVEDDHDIRVALRQSLEMANYTVLSASNGADALRIIRQQKPDLIILDMVMPLMDGEEFLRAKDSDASMSEIPVMVMSAYEEKLKVLPQRPNLKKPLDLDQILQKVPELLNKDMSPA